MNSKSDHMPMRSLCALGLCAGGYAILAFLLPFGPLMLFLALCAFILAGIAAALLPVWPSDLGPDAVDQDHEASRL